MLKALQMKSIFGILAFLSLVCLMCCDMALAKPKSQNTTSNNSTKSYITPTKQSQNNAKTNKDSALKLTLTPAEIAQITKNYKNPSSIFVGAGLGVGLQFVESSDFATTNTTSTLDMGFRAGYQYMPIDYIGLRIYLDYFLSIRPIGLESETSSTFLANFNAQGRIYAFAKDFEIGWVGGVGLGYGIHQNQISSQSNEDNENSEGNYGRGVFLGNVGIFGIIDKHHRVEILAKIPIVSFANTSKTHIYEDYSFLLAYDYLF